MDCIKGKVAMVSVSKSLYTSPPALVRLRLSQCTFSTSPASILAEQFLHRKRRDAFGLSIQCRHRLSDW